MSNSGFAEFVIGENGHDDWLNESFSYLAKLEQLEIKISKTENDEFNVAGRIYSSGEFSFTRSFPRLKKGVVRLQLSWSTDDIVTLSVFNAEKTSQPLKKL